VRRGDFGDTIRLKNVAHAFLGIMHPLGAPLFRVVGKTYEDSVDAREREMYIGLHDMRLALMPRRIKHYCVSVVVWSRICAPFLLLMCIISSFAHYQGEDGGFSFTLSQRLALNRRGQPRSSFRYVTVSPRRI